MSRRSSEDELLAPEPGETAENPMIIDEEEQESLSEQPSLHIKAELDEEQAEQHLFRERVASLPRIPKIRAALDEPPQLIVRSATPAAQGAQDHPQPSTSAGPSNNPQVNFNEKKLRLRELVYSLFPTYHEAVVCMSDTGRFIPCDAYNQGNLCTQESGHPSHRVKGKREGHICEVCHFAADLNNPHTAGNCKLEEFLLRKSHEMAHAHALNSLRETWQSPHAPARGRGRGRGPPRGIYKGKAPRGRGKNRK